MTILMTNDSGLEHQMPQGHPEQIARLEFVNAALSAPGFDDLDRRPSPMADETDLLLAHPEGHVTRIRDAAPKAGLIALDPDTSMSPGTWQAALRGVGGCLAAVDAVLAGEAKNAFVATRPPGHHAEKTRPMGFCLFGNVAIAAKHALGRHGLSRVAIVDFDVHHGNGTQDLLWDEDRVLFISSHQMPLYPGTGAAHERGAHGNILNVPLSPGSDGETMRSIYGSRLLPRLRDYQPELVLVSAGFDAHSDDPLANLNWSTEDFAWLTRELCKVADEVCEGRIVSSLEGGYNLPALANATAAHVLALMEA
ncbi:histone deacetylase family protein [Nioella nitratireducens]|uniref:histone deacetylase family protein n=1 Tax=Nioella nitratireducens TaxID=1287720 RepID=UPI0008FCE96F|nr:histone deacetylase family protein [Nioella nitratireducens]